MNYANRRKLRVGDTLIVQHYEPKGMFDDLPLTDEEISEHDEYSFAEDNHEDEIMPTVASE